MVAVVSHIGGRDDFLPFPYFSSVFLPGSVFPDSMVPSAKGMPEYLLLYTSYRFFDSSVEPGPYYVRHLLGMCLLDATRTLYTKYFYLTMIGSTSSVGISSSVEYPFQDAFIRLKRCSFQETPLLINIIMMR